MRTGPWARADRRARCWRSCGASPCGASTQDQIADLELLIKAAADSAEQRLVVAEYDGEVAGAVFLRLRR